MAVYVDKTPKQLLSLPHQICSPAKFARAPTSCAAVIHCINHIKHYLHKYNNIKNYPGTCS